MYKLNHTFLILAAALLALSSPLAASKENTRLLNGAARQAARGDTLTALEVVERVLRQPGRDDSKPYALYLSGLFRAGRGQADSAEVSFQRLIAEYPASEFSGTSLAQLGSLLYRQGQDSLAVLVLEPLAVAFPDSSFTPSALISMQRAADRARLSQKAIRAGLQYLSGSAGQSPELIPVMQRTATLLLENGRAEEAWGLVRRIQEITGKSLYEQELNTQMLAIGCLGGIGQPDSALRLIEELRRGSGEQMLYSPAMRFLLAQACLSRGDLAGADSVFTALASAGGNLEKEGFSRDSVLALLMDLDYRQGRNEQFMAHGVERLRLIESPEAALSLLGRMKNAAERSGNLSPLVRSVELFGQRFGSSSQFMQARLIGAWALAASGDRRGALSAIEDLYRQRPDSLILAQAGLTACGIYLSLHDTLRAEAELRDYLNSGSDPLNVMDSLLHVYARICRSRGDFSREQALLRRLCDNYPSSRYWDQSSLRLSDLARFELTDPSGAARELLDLFSSQRGNIPPQRLAEIAGRRLGDYDRAVSILQAAGSIPPADRVPLAEYLYLAGLRDQSPGENAGVEKIRQAWRDLGRLLSENAEFQGRENAVGLYLDIYRSHAATLNAGEKSAAETLLRGELPHLAQGAVRTALLIWLGELYEASAEGAMTAATLARADSARMMWAQAISGSGTVEQSGRAMLLLARSLENAGFAGAMDSAAHLYGTLTGRWPQSRWAALAGLRIARMHLSQERYSVAYATARNWVSHNTYASDTPECRAVLAEAAYHTGRYGLAAALFGRMEQDSLERNGRMRFECYRIRALAGIGEYAAANSLLVRYLSRCSAPEERQAGFAAAVDLFLEAGNSRQAMQYLAQLPEQSEFHALARVRWLVWSLEQGADAGKTRKELERYRKSAWNEFYKVDPSLLAYRGIMIAYMNAGDPEKVAETRNEFRRNFPEDRAGLAGLMLDEIEYLLNLGQLDGAASLNDDLRLLFGDVWPEDRALWVGAALDRARGETAASAQALDRLAREFTWSPWSVEAKQKLIELYVAANQIDKARKLLESLPPEISTATRKAGMLGQILGGEGNWVGAVEQFAKRWAGLAPSAEAGRAALDWAGAALKAGRNGNARAILSSLWSRDPETVAAARFLLVSLLRGSREYSQAVDMMDGLCEAYPERTEITLKALYQKGLIQEAMGQREAASATYRQLETLAAGHSDWVRSARDRLRALTGSGQP